MEYVRLKKKETVTLYAMWTRRTKKDMPQFVTF